MAVTDKPVVRTEDEDDERCPDCGFLVCACFDEECPECGRFNCTCDLDEEEERGFIPW